MQMVETVQSYAKEDGGTGTVIILISMACTHPTPLLDALCGSRAAVGSTTPVWR